MRTKHILTTLALPALFAACTADEFETVNPGNGLQEERAKVSENFTLLTNGLQTRYAVEGGAGISFNFEKGDQIGAAIIDQYDPEAKKPEDFKVIYSLAGNNPFEFQGNDEWKSNTQLGIGHYLFVYPYNSADNNRAAVAYELPVIQQLGEGAEGLNAAIEKGNKAVAAAVLHEGEESVDISLKNLFTYPKLTINFDNGEDVTTVSQIVLKANDPEDAFIVKGGFDHKVVAEMFNPSEENENKNLSENYYYADKGATKPSMHWDEVNTYDFLLSEEGEGAAYNPFKEGRTSDYIIVKFPEGTKVKPAANTNNKYVEARIMMPSIAKFNETELDGKYTLFVYTDNGVYSAPFEPSAFSFSDKTDDEKIEKALARSASNGLTLRVEKSEEDAGTIVTTLKDWNELVAKFGKTKQDQTVIVVGDDFAFDETAEWPETCTFTINTDVTVKGEVEIENVTVNGTINVEKGAVLTVGNTLNDEVEAGAKGASIVNEGTVIIAAEYDFATFDKNQKTKVAYDGVNYIANKGTVEVAEKANAKFALDNCKGAEVNNNGTMEVKDGDGYKVAGTEYTGNNGIINNNGLMKTAGFTNAKVELSKDEKKIVNIPEINNAEGARILAVEGAFKNYASLVNEGELTCRNQGGKIVNADDDVQIVIDADEKENSIYPILDSKKDALTYITENEADATILVYDDDPELLTIGTPSGYVKYEAAAKETVNTKDSYVNVVVANGDLTVANGSNLTTLIVANGATLTWGSAKATTNSPAPTMQNLVIEEGVLTLASPDNKVIVNNSLTVAEGAQMTVPEGVAFTLNGEEYKNDGRILVGGAFTAEKVAEDKDNVESYGNASEINWAKTEADEAEDAYDAALTKMVQAWILNKDRNSWGEVNKIAEGNWTSSNKAGLADIEATWNSLATAAYKAYNKWQEAMNAAAVADLNTYLSSVFKKEAAGSGKVAKIIADYKKDADTDRIAAFKDKYSEKSWLDNDWGGFIRDKADTEVKDVKTESGSSLVEYLVNKMKSETSVDYAEKSTEDADLQAVQNKAIVLSLKEVTTENITDYTCVPEYSYVSVYEGSQYGEYEVMKGLKELKTVLGGPGQILENADLTKVNGVKAALSDIYDAYDEMLSYAEKKIVDKYSLRTRIDKVYDEWMFNDKQIETLNKKVQ